MTRQLKRTGNSRAIILSLRRILGYSVLLFAVVLAGCSESPTGSGTDPGPDQPPLLLSQLVVSVIPGGSESVTIHTTGGASGPFTVNNDAPGVASASITESIVTVTGLTFGIANLTISNASGDNCTLPVQVYDHMVLEVEDLLVTYTDTFDLVFFYSWKPIPSEGYHALGSLYHGEMFSLPNGVKAAMVVKAKPGTDAIAFTKEFESTSYPYKTGWTPVAPSGYVALGHHLTYEWPAPDSAACIREDLTTTAVTSERLRNLEISSPANYWLSYWKIDQRDAGPHPGAYLTPGTFLCVYSTGQPMSHPAAHVLDVELPMLAEAPYQEFVPRLTGYETLRSIVWSERSTTRGCITIITRPHRFRPTIS